MNVTLSSDADELNEIIKQKLRNYTKMATETDGLVEKLYFHQFQDIDQANAYIKDGIQSLTTEDTIMARMQKATMSIAGQCKRAVVWCSRRLRREPKDGHKKTKKQYAHSISTFSSFSSFH